MYGIDGSHGWRRMSAVAGLALALTFLGAGEARAHCDTMDGPVVAAARQALESGSVNRVLHWVGAKDEAEIVAAFREARAVRALGPAARELADRNFFETVVRVHRAGEGAPYTGLKAAGASHDPAVAAVDRALAAGDAAEVERLLVHELRDALRARFERARAARAFAAGDVAAGRAYVAAYVPLVHFAEEVHALATGGGHAGEPAAATPAAAKPHH